MSVKYEDYDSRCQYDGAYYIVVQASYSDGNNNFTQKTFTVIIAIIASHNKANNIKYKYRKLIKMETLTHTLLSTCKILPQIWQI